MSKIVLGLSAIAVATIIGTTVYAQTVSTREGETVVGRIDYVEIHEEQNIAGVSICTTSSTYEDIPGLTKTFSQGGGLGNETIIAFRAQMQQSNSGGAADLDVRLLIDGIPQSGSGSEIGVFDGAANVFDGLFSWNFISDPVSSGTHTAKLQWRATSEACIYSRSMIIHHR
jgi:hypothetical protein